MSRRTTAGVLFLSLLLAPSPARADEAEQKAQDVLRRLGSSYNPLTDHVVHCESAVTDDDLHVLAGLTQGVGRERRVPKRQPRSRQLPLPDWTDLLLSLDAPPAAANPCPLPPPR
jgi:hypothetical protein